MARCVRQDTTPTWSTRGKLRRQLVPLLADMYGEGFKANLSSLVSHDEEADREEGHRHRA